MRTQSFLVPGRPNTNHRPRHMVQLSIEKPKKLDKRGREREVRNQVTITGTAMPFMDTDYKKYVAFIRDCAIEVGIEKYERCRVEIFVHMPMLGTSYKTKRNYVSERKDRSDIDNHKAVMDALTGIAYEDDAHVLSAPPHTVFEAPGSDWWVEVFITEMHWTECISDDARKWCQDHNFYIPTEETNGQGTETETAGLFGPDE